MEGKEKTFGELKKGDTIYFFHKDMFDGPGILREYVLEHEPSSTGWGGIKTCAIRLNGGYLYEGLEFADDDIEDTLNITDFNYNCLQYGDEYWYFTTNKEHAIIKRKEILEAYIFRTEENLNELKTKLENHLKEYGDIGF
jgi:hypothetical protein